MAVIPANQEQKKTQLLLALPANIEASPGAWGVSNDTAALQAILAGLIFKVSAPCASQTGVAAALQNCSILTRVSPMRTCWGCPRVLTTGMHKL